MRSTLVNGSIHKIVVSLIFHCIALLLPFSGKLQSVMKKILMNEKVYVAI